MAAVGAPGDNNNVGACFTWKRDGTTWTRTNEKFSTNGAGSRLGSSVALSGSGFRLAIGAPGFNNNTGAIVMGNGIGRNGSLNFFSYTGAPYDFYIPPILVGQAQFGSSVSFGKGIYGLFDPLIIGAPGDSNGIGAVWVYYSGAASLDRGIKLVPNGAVGAARHGTSVYLDSDFSTAIVGAPGDNNNTGAVWVYTFDGSTWTQQGSKLVGTGALGAARQGYSVSLSADGNLAMVGGPDDNNNIGAAWVYTRSGGTWSQQGNKLVGSGAQGASYQGVSASLSANGTIAMVGGRGDNSGAGAAWVYAEGRTVTYNGNSNTGGSVPAATIGAIGGSINLDSNSGSLTKTGYSFVGWNTLANGTGTSYAAGASYALSANITLYAKWTNVPDAPTGLSATAINGCLLTFTAPANGVDAITNYQYSTDNGASWTAVSPASTNTTIILTGLSNCTAYNIRVRAVNSVGVGAASTAVSVTPRTGVAAGTNWTSRTSAADNYWRGVTYGNGLFVAVAYSGIGNRVMTSPDGINWTTRTSAADNDWRSVTYGNGLFVAVASSGIGNRVMTSPDGITWTIRTSAADNDWRSATYGNGLFVAVAE